MSSDNSRGPNFELKLLTLFCVRALAAGYKFELSKEKEEEGGKLDDVIFRYEVADETPAGKHWRYRFLQAKHKKNREEKINADLLLPYNSKGKFSLPKYFHSYYKIRARGEDIQDCIICTNIGFHLDSLAKRGVELVSIDDQPEDILAFGAQTKTARYKLQINGAEWHRQLREEWSPVRLLAEELKDCATKNKTTDIRKGTILNSYHVALVKEHVIDYITEKLGKFHDDFLNNAVNLSEGARELRQTISILDEDNWEDWKFKLSNNFGKSQSTEVNNPLPKLVEEADITDYFDKLIFVVNMPNEENFDQIIETEDISKYYPSENCENERRRIINDEIQGAFRDPPANFWLTSEEGKKILLAGVNAVSLEYQRQLEMNVAFNDTAIRVMKKKLRQLMKSPGNSKVKRIFTTTPQFTAVKVISAIQVLMRELEQEGNYFVVSSSLLQDKEKIKRWENILKLQKGFHHFLVVVCDNEDSIENFENLFVDHQDDNNFRIIISRSENLDENDEEIKYTDLTEHFQSKILTKIVSLFQEEEKTLTVRDLVGDKPEEVIDFCSIQELLSEEKEIQIPSFNTSTSELYIKRKLRFPFDGQFELGGECRISPDGHIKWFVEEKEQKEVWQKIMDEITNRASSTHKIVEDSDLIEEKSIVIISEVAGSGKSTILSHFYKEIKEKKPDHWVIRINLFDRFEELKKSDKVENLDNAVDFLVNQLHVVDEKSSFSRSLLKNRLKTGDRIVFLFDGFDEIHDQCQVKAIQLMEVINEEKSIPLYITTRTHMLDKLQFEFSQLAYSLENFTEKDQIDYLINFWNREINLEEKYDGLLRQFAACLIERVSKTLKDEKKLFVGIPLQCRILADCFQSNVKELIETPTSTEHNISRLLVDKKFDIISLYELLITTKRKVFLKEKANATNANQIVSGAIGRLINDVEDHLTKLAITLFVEDKDKVHILWPPHPHKSEENKDKEEQANTKYGYAFGLTTKDYKGKETFLHRTYAEYYFAKFLFEGFELNEEKHNKLLENETARNLIVKDIFTEKVEWKHYHGVRVFLDLMLVDTAEEWYNIVENQSQNPDKKKFPKRLRKLNKSFIKYRCFDKVKLANFLKGCGNLIKFLTSNMDFHFNLKTHKLRIGSSTTNLESTTTIAT